MSVQAFTILLLFRITLPHFALLKKQFGVKVISRNGAVNCSAMFSHPTSCRFFLRGQLYEVAIDERLTFGEKNCIFIMISIFTLNQSFQLVSILKIVKGMFSFLKIKTNSGRYILFFLIKLKPEFLIIPLIVDGNLGKMVSNYPFN